MEGGLSLTMWDAFYFNITTNIDFLNEQMFSENYENILKSHQLPAENILGGKNWTF